MDFEFDEGQLALQATAAEILAKECDPSFVRGVVEDGRDASGFWNLLCGLEWPGLAIEQAAGGSGASAVELAIVLEQLGYVCDPSPFVATTTQFAALVAECGDDAQRRQFLQPITEGVIGAAVLKGVEARPVENRWQLFGEAPLVLDGDRAAQLVVVALGSSGPSVFVMPSTDAVVTRTAAFDATLHLSTVSFDGVFIGADRRLGRADEATIARANHLALLGMSMTSVGACQRALDLVVDYTKSREQFGVPIGSFQAVKHKAVDMYVAIERARSLAYFAALAIAEDDDRRALAASMAKATTGDAQRVVFQHAIQLFGGIGFTWENDLHLYLRRAKATELLLGGASEHRAAVAKMLLDARQPSKVLNG